MKKSSHSVRTACTVAAAWCAVLSSAPGSAGIEFAPQHISSLTPTFASGDSSPGEAERLC